MFKFWKLSFSPFSGPSPPTLFSIYKCALKWPNYTNNALLQIYGVFQKNKHTYFPKISIKIQTTLLPPLNPLSLPLSSCNGTPAAWSHIAMSWYMFSERQWETVWQFCRGAGKMEGLLLEHLLKGHFDEKLNFDGWIYTFGGYVSRFSKFAIFTQ